MKKLYLFVLALFLTTGLKAQSNASISGSAIQSDESPLSFATVLLKAGADSSILRSALSDDNGKFGFQKLSAGAYLLEIRYVGMEAQTKSIELTENQNLELKPIQLKETGTQIDEVQIVAEKPILEVKADKTIFNVEGTVNAIGTNALDLLRKSPGVLVDNNDNILLLGKNGVRIYIDGKPSPLSAADLATMLRSMESSQIESIEIITNPSSRYDAEGNAGIINIRMKKDKSLGANANISAGYAIGRYSKYNGSGTLNYRNKKVNVFGNYSASTGLTFNTNDLFRIQSNTILDMESEAKNRYTNHNYKAGVDFFLDKKHTLGIMINGYVSDWNWRNNSRTPITTESTGEVQSVLIADSDNFGDNGNINANLNYRFDSGEGTTWNIDADYGYFLNDTRSDLPNFYLDPTEQTVLLESLFATEAPTQIDIYTFKVDHERTLGKGKLGAGIKFSYVETDNTFDFYNIVGNEEILDRDRSNNFIYTENVNAAYVNYQQQIKKFNIQLGLRAEQTNSEGDLISSQNGTDDNVRRNYLDLFPSGGLTYQFSPKHMTRLSYSRRIDRPRYDNLNPFELKLDELTFQKGNPFLRPQYTHNIQLTHTYNYSLNVTLGFSRTDDFFSRIVDTLGTQASFITQANVGVRDVYSANISYPFAPIKWWSIYTNFTLSHTNNDGEFNGKQVAIDQTSYNVYQQHTFQLPRDFSLQLSGFYNSPGVFEANFKSRAMYSIDIGIQKKLWKGRGNLSVSVSDVFQTLRFRGEQEFGGLFLIANSRWESRQLKFNLTYLLGNNQVKTSRRRKTGLEDESRRVGKGQN